jgi:hypothetical protein
VMFAGKRESPEQIRAYWYQWYFNTERGRQAFEDAPIPFCEYLWPAWSPRWKFTSAEMETAKFAWSNPQFAATGISRRVRTVSPGGAPASCWSLQACSREAGGRCFIRQPCCVWQAERANDSTGSHRRAAENTPDGKRGLSATLTNGSRAGPLAVFRRPSGPVEGGHRTSSAKAPSAQDHSP